MTNAIKIKSVFAMLALALTVTMSGPLRTEAFAEDMVVSDDEDDNGNSEDHANENANENATGGDEECGSTIENSRC
jgi:hypothetical protein